MIRSILLPALVAYLVSSWTVGATEPFRTLNRLQRCASLWLEQMLSTKAEGQRAPAEPPRAKPELESRTTVRVQAPAMPADKAGRG